MNVVYGELTDRIRGTVLDLDRIVERVTRAWARAQTISDDQDAYLDSVALIFTVSTQGWNVCLRSLPDNSIKQSPQAKPGTGICCFR